MRKTWIHEELILQGAVGAGMIVSAVIGAGSAAYQADEQKKIADSSAKDVLLAEKERKAEVERIARDTRPDGEALDSIEFGVDREENELGSVSDFLRPKTTALGTTANGGSGLFAGVPL